MAESGFPPLGKKPKFDWGKERRNIAISEAVDAKIISESSRSEKGNRNNQRPTTPPKAMAEAFAKAKPLEENGKRNGNGKSAENGTAKMQDPEVPPVVSTTPMAETSKSDVIPPGLGQNERKLYLKLPKEKRRSYLAHLTEMRVNKARKEKQEEGRPEAQATKPAIETIEAVDAIKEGIEIKEKVDDRIATDGTPAEWRKKLRTLIKGAGEAELLGTGKMSERLRAHLAERSGELDEEAKEYGPKIAEFISSGIEKYNKLHWAKKLFVTGSLVAGVSLTSAVAPIISGLLTAALYGQRVVGGAGLLKSQREKFDTYAWSKDRSKLLKNTLSVVMAGVWAGGTMYAVQEGVEALNALGVGEWLDTTPKSVADAPPEVPKPAAVAAAGEDAPILHELITEPPGTVPEISVGASAGHGYEYMTKQLWEQLQDKGLDPNQYAEGSDIRRLLEADASSIDKVVHQIAADPEHGFFNADGTSVRISLDSHMTVNADGNIQLDDIVKAPEDAPTTPAYHPETPEVTGEPEAPTPPVEEGVAAPDDSVLRDNEGNVVHDGEGNPVHTGTYETPPGTNEFGLTIPADEPHIYADSGDAHLFVYGGSSQERANTILEYLTKHPDKIVYGSDDNGAHRIPFYLLEGKVTAGLPVRTSGFLGFFSSWMKAPGPDEFAKIIK